MKRWLPIALAAVVALGLAALLVPSGFERAFMQLRDQDFLKATDSFAKRWESGDRSREVANALSELLVRKGQPDRAADILRLYVGEHPDDREALTRLAEIFRDDQQRDAYIATMETLWKKDRHVDVLRCLIALYGDAGRDEEQVKALADLVRMRGAVLGDFEALARLQSTRDPKLALQTLFNAFERWGGKVGPDTAQSFAVLATGQDRDDLVRATLVPWLAAQATYAAIEPVANALALAKQDNVALKGVLASKALQAAEPMTVTLAARLEAKLGQWHEARERLKALRASGKMPAAARDIFLQAAMRTDARREAREFLIEQGPAAFPPWLQSWTISTALELGDRDFLVEAGKQLSVADKPDTIFFRARLELALDNRDKAIALTQRLRKSTGTPSDTIAVASLLVDLADLEAARALLSSVAGDAEAVPVDDLLPATDVAIGVHEAKIAMALASRLRKLVPGEPADIAYARALGLNRDTTKALAILDGLSRWSDARELATFEVLKAAGQTERLQALLLERMCSDTATVAQRTNYAFMLNDFKEIGPKPSEDALDALVDDLDDDAVAGTPRLARIELLGKLDPGKALPYARAEADDDPDHAAYLLLALLKKLNQPTEAIAYISSTMPRVSGKTRESLMFEWIALGVTPQAVPYLKTFAESNDRQWFFACDEALRKLGNRKERLDFLANYARRGDLDDRFRNELASEILEAGDKDTAIELYRTLANSAPPRSSAVEQLLYLWGPRPPATGVAWILERARTSPQADRAAWLERLIEVGSAADAARLGSTWYAAGDRAMALPLAAAFVLSKSKFEMRNLALAELSAGNVSPKDAGRLAQATEEVDLPHEASLLYEVAGRAEPRWLAAAGRTAWYAGEQTRARGLLERAMANGQPDAETLFLLAEAMTAARDASRAASLYAQALESASKVTNAAALRIRVLSLARLHRTAEAERLVSESKDPSLRQDLASALLDGGDVPTASRLLVTQRRR